MPADPDHPTDLPLPQQAFERPEDLTALLGSRICHDIISPLGAIGNGVELLAMGGSIDGPEMALITESVASAKARVRFFRVAFGHAGPDQRIAHREVESILADMTRGGRTRIEWQVEGDQPRGEVKLAFLALQCLETAMPYGGTVAVTRDGVQWQVAGTAPKLKVDEALFRGLSDPAAQAPITAAQVQFALLPQEAARQSRRIGTLHAPEEIAIRF